MLPRSSRQGWEARYIRNWTNTCRDVTRTVVWKRGNASVQFQTQLPPSVTSAKSLRAALRQPAIAPTLKEAVRSLCWPYQTLGYDRSVWECLSLYCTRALGGTRSWEVCVTEGRNLGNSLVKYKTRQVNHICTKTQILPSDWVLVSPGSSR